MHSIFSSVIHMNGPIGPKVVYVYINTHRGPAGLLSCVSATALGTENKNHLYERLSKRIENRWAITDQASTKIYQQSVLVATKTETRKQSAKMYQKISKNVENWSPNGDPFWDTFWPSGPSLLSQASLGSQNDSQGPPKSLRDQSKLQFSPFFGGFG